VGFNSAEHPHLRIEQRVMSSGPTLIDMIANTAFAVGLIDYLSQMEKPPEESLTFTDCTENFYQAAKASLLAKIKWGGKTISITDLFSELLPKVNNQLKKMGIDSDSADFYINEVIGERVRQSLNGALWQKMYFKYCGNDLKEVTLAYLENQNEGKPVHLWKKYI
jgi:gamma-glutamyl:cysteine ligase YbdK (ATP-grasp superfamily)